MRGRVAVLLSQDALSKPVGLFCGVGEELSRAAALNLFVPLQDGAQVKLELEAASSVAGLAGLQAAAERPAFEPTNLIQQTMQALARAQEQQSEPSEVAAKPETGPSVGNPPSYPY